MSSAASGSATRRRTKLRNCSRDLGEPVELGCLHAVIVLAPSSTGMALRELRLQLVEAVLEAPVLVDELVDLFAQLLHLVALVGAFTDRLHGEAGGAHGAAFEGACRRLAAGAGRAFVALRVERASMAEIEVRNHGSSIRVIRWSTISSLRCSGTYSPRWPSMFAAVPREFVGLPYFDHSMSDVDAALVLAARRGPGRRKRG